MMAAFQKNKGFSLVELMIVVAILSILASVAVPYYQRYVAKSRLTSLVLPAVHSLENNISAFYAVWNRLPRIPEDAELLQFSSDADTHFVTISYADWPSLKRLRVIVNTDATDPRYPSATRKPFQAIGSDLGRNVFYMVAQEIQTGQALRLYWSYQGTLAAEFGM